ncbi:hypothetical protein [Flavobacterium sp. 14A]|uniref:hypothetical protein n=1 Tax=Flavobacterium sp. 14A TaxID=2735896 RepID=UPI00156FC036|nr:hypothetical protein [Flavobacterium sp. 14A]NRT10465.1 hypothetical protein [Flavobacterium sp. 14A]
MIFIPPMEIATRIMTLIDNAQKELIIVSPYISIDNWQKLKKCLQRAVDRSVTITIYARENAQQNLDVLRAFKVNLILVKDLHAKIYINESYAIASSQNLIQYSDDNSIDFGYSTETEEERQQLLGLINQYLVVSIPTRLRKRDLSTDSKIANNIEIKTVFFKSADIIKIYDAFSERYNQGRTNGADTYVYCSKFFAFADLMLREGLQIRFNHLVKDRDSIVTFLENLDIKTRHYQFKKTFRGSAGRYGEFMFLPEKVYDIKLLIEDYMFICDKIKDITAHLDNSHAN